MNVILLLFNSFLENICMISFTKMSSQYQSQVYLFFPPNCRRNGRVMDAFPKIFKLLLLLYTTSMDTQSYSQL